MTSCERIPALVVSGFLGSGKTTLIRELLAEAVRRGLRVALVSNELGELGVDRALLGGGEEAYVELEGGCVCCELSDDLVDTLQMLREKVDPDRIVIETSGVALPFDTQLNFWREPVRDWIGDDTAIVVVNAEQLLDERELVGTFEDQVSSADLLILNKVDLVPDAELPALEARLRELEPEAPVVRSTRGAVDPILLFPPEASSTRRDGAPPAPRPHTHEQFSATTIDVPRSTPTDLERILRSPDILRAKGFVDTTDGLRLIQLVGPRLELTTPEAPPDPNLIGKLVIIRRVDSPTD